MIEWLRFCLGNIRGEKQMDNKEPGHWLEIEVIHEPQGKIIEQWQCAKCSVCEHYHPTPYMYAYTHYDYCPSCGAKMER